MEIVTSTKCTEEEILVLIRTHLPLLRNYDSIVAYEEIGNEVLSREVSKLSAAQFDADVIPMLDGADLHWRLSTILDLLCTLGHLPEGSILIDCTW